MATYYVRSTTGNDANDGLTWATAKATLGTAVVGALAVAVAGDRIWVSQVHAETQATAMTLTSAGTAAAPVEILCGNDAAEPPTALATTATVTTTGNSDITCAGFAYVYGITFSASSGAVNRQLSLGGAFTPFGWVLDTCGLVCPATGSGASVGLGGTASTSNDAVSVLLRNCTIQLPANAAAGLQLRHGYLRMLGGSFVTTSTPAAVCTLSAGAAGDFVARGVDLSLFGSGKALVNVGVATVYRIAFEQCKLGASVALTTGTNPGPGGPIVLMDNCDSADTQYRMQRHSYEGDVYSETTIVRTGGASNGTTPLSHRMVSSASRVFVDPLYGPDLVIWNNLTGSAKTVTVEIVHDSATNLTDAQVWLEVEYLGTSGFPLSLFAMDRAATIIATPVDQAASSVAWTTTGIAVVNKQKLEVTFTPQEIGIIRARVALAKPSYTIYADPLLTVA